MKRHSQKRSIYAILICFGLLFPPETRGFAFALPAIPSLAAIGAKVKALYIAKQAIEGAVVVVGSVATVGAGLAYVGSHVGQAGQSAYNHIAGFVADQVKEQVVEKVQQKGKEAVVKTVAVALVGDSSKQTQQTPSAPKTSEVPASVKTEPKVNADKSHTTKTLQDTADKFLNGKHKVGDATLSTGQSQSNAKNDTASKATDFSRDTGVRSDEMHKSAGELSRVMDKIKPGHETSTISLSRRKEAWSSKNEALEVNYMKSLAQEYHRTGNEELLTQLRAKAETFKATFGKDFEIPRARVIGFGDPNKPLQIFENQQLLAKPSPDVSSQGAPAAPSPDHPVQPGPVVPAPAGPSKLIKADEKINGGNDSELLMRVLLAKQALDQLKEQPTNKHETIDKLKQKRAESQPPSKLDDQPKGCGETPEKQCTLETEKAKENNAKDNAKDKTPEKQPERDTGAQAPGKPREEDGFIPAKNWDGNKVPTKRGWGWPDKDGNVWVPTGPKGHGGAHWDVQLAKNRGYKNIVPGGRIRGEK